MSDHTLQVEPFLYGDTSVRTVVIDGEPFFVLADLCRVLDLSAVGRVAARLDEGVRRTHTLQTPGGAQQMTVVNEAGMYEVVIRSDKPEAAAFRRWITGTVLPELRRNGSFGSPALAGAELLAHAVIEAQAMLAAKDERIAELEPQAELAANYLTAQGGARLFREVAKPLGIRERDLRRFLIDEKMIFAKHAQCGDVMYDHYAQFAHHFQARETVVNHTWGSCSHYTLYLLPRGVELVRKRLAAAPNLVVTQ